MNGIRMISETVIPETGGSSLRKGETTESSPHNAELNDCEVILLETGGDVINGGETYDIVLLSNIVTTESGLTYGIRNGTNNHGYPIIRQVDCDVDGTINIQILNLGAQGKSEDVSGTLILTIVILN